MLRILTSIAAAGAVLPAADAYLVAPGSPCSDGCGNVLTSVGPADVVCGSTDYTSGYNNGAGPVFQQCMQCEVGSPYYDKQTNYTDAMALLYNLRYTVSYCVFDYPVNQHVGDNPCVTNKACGNFINGTEYRNLSTQYDGYEYCDEWPTSDSLDFQGCVQCLQAASLNYLANFVVTLQAGCEQKPAPGVTLGIEGSLFSTVNVNITSPTPTAEADFNWKSHGPLTLGGKVGIAVGGLLVMLIITGTAIVWNGKRKRRAFLKNLEVQYANAKNGGWPSPPHRDMGETPISQRPLRGWDDSPMTANTEKTFPRYFSPYSSQYNSPVSALETQHMPWPEPALGSPREIGIALGSGIESPAGWSMPSDDKGKMKDESYEMQYVESAGGTRYYPPPNMPQQHLQAPILAHPGYGRGTDSPPRQYDAAEQDARNSNMI